MKYFLSPGEFYYFSEDVTILMLQIFIFLFHHCFFSIIRAAAGATSLPGPSITKIRKFCDQMESPATMFGVDDQSSLKKEILPDTEFLKVIFFHNNNIKSFF